MFTVFNSAELQWKYVCGVCTEGAPAMMESSSDFRKKFKILPLKQEVHTFIISRYALASRTLPTPLKMCWIPQHPPV